MNHSIKCTTAPIDEYDFRLSDHFKTDYALDLDLLATKAIEAFNKKCHWIQYFDYCNSLFAESKLDVIHKAKSIAVMIELLAAKNLLDEFNMKSEQILQNHVVPVLMSRLKLHRDIKVETLRDLRQTLAHIGLMLNKREL